MDAWNSVTELLAGQHGVVGRHQLDELHISKATLARWVEQRRLKLVGPRVWRVVGGAVTWHQRLMSGLLSLGPSAAVSHRSAAHVHRFDRSGATHVEFLVPRGERHGRIDTSVGAMVHSSKMFPPIDVVVVAGLRVTSATRTILDLANIRVHPDVVKAAIDSAVRLQLSAPEVIIRRLSDIRRRGRGGVRLIDELLLDSGGHTMLERRFLELIRSAGLPKPKPQVVFTNNGRHVARVDFLYEAWDLVVEVSGRLGHSSPSERARDAQRRNELQDLGVRVYEFTWEDVTKRGHYVIATVRRLLSFLSPSGRDAPSRW